jgi:hypothetical protein
MQQHTYTAKTSRIISQSFLVWLIFAIQIAFNVFLVISGLANGRMWAIVPGNACFCLLSLPGIFLFFNYYKHSVGKKFIITHHSLKYVDEKSGKAIELLSNEIEHVYLVENVTGSKFAWMFYAYFAFTDKSGKTIIVTSYFMDLYEFWQDSLTAKVNASKLIRIKKLFPVIKTNK